MAALYVVGTPIGNLQEVSPRVRQTLSDCTVLLCEDTRVTHKLLSALTLTGKHMISCHQHNERGRAQEIVQRMLLEDIDVALVTDAGTPCISDPGYLVVQAVTQAGLSVYPISGASAVVDALSICGFAVDSYAFLGFLPRDGKERTVAFERMRALDVAVVVVYESPHRIKHLVTDLIAEFPNAKLSVSCDLTKYYELTLRGSPAEVLEKLNANPNTEKGEYVVVIDLPEQVQVQKKTVSAQGLLLTALFEGMDMKSAMRHIHQEADISRNDAYKASMEVKNFLAAWKDNTR